MITAKIHTDRPIEASFPGPIPTGAQPPHWWEPVSEHFPPREAFLSQEAKDIVLAVTGRVAADLGKLGTNAIDWSALRAEVDEILGRIWTRMVKYHEAQREHDIRDLVAQATAGALEALKPKWTPPDGVVLGLGGGSSPWADPVDMGLPLDPPTAGPPPGEAWPYDVTVSLPEAAPPTAGSPATAYPSIEVLPSPEPQTAPPMDLSAAPWAEEEPSPEPAADPARDLRPVFAPLRIGDAGEVGEGHWCVKANTKFTVIGFALGRAILRLEDGNILNVEPTLRLDGTGQFIDLQIHVPPQAW